MRYNLINYYSIEVMLLSNNILIVSLTFCNTNITFTFFAAYARKYASKYNSRVIECRANANEVTLLFFLFIYFLLKQLI